MIDWPVIKIIAKDGEREYVPSSEEEKQRFIVEGKRPEFDDPRVICVAFILSYDSDEFGDDCREDCGEDYWYINPSYCKEHDGKNNIFNSEYAYGPVMPYKYPPELFLLELGDFEQVISAYDVFVLDLRDEGVNDIPLNKKIRMFVERYPQICEELL